MPFSLKNAGATYQRSMVTLFHDIMHKEIDVYVDNMIASSALSSTGWGLTLTSASSEPVQGICLAS